MLDGLFRGTVLNLLMRLEGQRSFLRQRAPVGRDLWDSDKINVAESEWFWGTVTKSIIFKLKS